MLETGPVEARLQDLTGRIQRLEREFALHLSAHSTNEHLAAGHQSAETLLRELAQSARSLVQCDDGPALEDASTEYSKISPVTEILLLKEVEELGFDIECAVDGTPVVSKVLEGTTAARCGVRSGDMLLSCNGIHPDRLEGFEELLALLNVRPMLLRFAHGDPTGTAGSPTAKGSRLHRIITPSFFSNEPSIVDVLGTTSSIAKWVLFLGGFSVLENRKLHILYLMTFILSFTCCFLSCAANLFFQKPPYTSFAVDALTMYLHIFGLHTWLNWRRYARDPQLRRLVQRCLCRGHSSIQPALLEQLCRHIRFLARFFAMVQVLAVIMGYYVLPTRSLDYGLEVKRQLERQAQGSTGFSSSSVFAFVHAGLMYLAIPSHVPTVVAAYGMLFLVCRLHALDVGRFEHLMGGTERNNPVKTDLKILLKMCVDLAADMQDKLTATCTTLQNLLLHQFAYVFMQLFVAGLEFKHYYRNGVGSDAASLSELFYKFWHLCLGLLGLTAIALAPAGVTAAFRRCSVHVVQGLKARGADQRFARQGAEDVAYGIVGFQCCGVEISPNFVSSFTSIMFLVLALVIDLDG